MRTGSAASIRHMSGRRSGNAARQLRPDPESAIGQLYDLFMANKAKPVQLPSDWMPKGHNTWRFQLEEIYGLDIRKVPGSMRGGRRGPGRASYMLVGEWFGPTYVDYFAQRIVEEERAADKLDPKLKKEDPTP